MRCSVAFCKNSSNTEQDLQSSGISFYSFPNDLHLRAAWLKALGKQDAILPDSAMVCSRHFLKDDIYVTESGLRQINAVAVPSIIMGCIVCLDSDSKLFLMRKNKLGEAYEKLTGYPVCDQGNFKPTVCVHCAQRLINFSAFRDKCLRAHTLMELVGKQESITKQHIKMINHAKNQLRNNLVVSMQGVDPCDLYIQEDPSDDNQIESNATEFKVVVKSEESDDSMSVDDNMEVINDECYNKDDINEVLFTDPLKYKSEFVQVGDSDGGCGRSWDSEVHKSHTAVGFSSGRKAFHSTPFVAKLVSNSEHKVQDEKSEKLQKTVQVFKTENSRSDSKLHSSSDIDESSTLNKKNCFNCNVCKKTFKLKSILVNHMKTHSDTKPFNCQFCHFKSKHKYSLISHMRTHTGDKPYCCKLCDFKCDRNGRLVLHMRTHTSEKPFSCTQCHYKCTTSGQLVRHTRTHTGERPYSCTLCEYKCTQSSDLVKHMRVHTGDRPYACKVCDYKCKQSCDLVKHQKTHASDKLLS